MEATNSKEALRLGDSILIETTVGQVPLSMHGKVSSLLPKVVWVNISGPGFPPLVKELKAGHPITLSAARECNALVGDSTFQSCPGISRRLVAVSRPTDLRLIDRRATLRVAMRKSLGIRVARGSAAGEGGHFSIGTTVDICMTGIRFETAVHMAVGEHVFLTLVLEQNRQLYALAQIVRLDDAIPSQSLDRNSPADPWHDGRRLIRAAARWDAIAPADRERLQSFLLSSERAPTT